MLICGFTCLGLLNNAQAQGKYPNQPIQLVVPFTPGGTNDLAARMYTEKLAQTLKVPVIVVNRGAGGGIQGTLFVARAKKDGYTLVATTDANMLIPPITTKEATFDPLKDFSLWATLAISPIFLRLEVILL